MPHGVHAFALTGGAPGECTDAGAAIVLHGDDGAILRVQPYGAHVTSWITPGGGEQLYLSERTALDGRTPVRGGIPVIFPQFAGEGPLPRHGFARTQPWQVAEVAATGPSPYAVLELADNEVTRAVWPHAFLAQLRAELGDGSLRVSLTIYNPASSPFSFTGALHTYLHVTDAFAATVEGLGGIPFRESGRPAGTFEQNEGEVTIFGGINRVYVGVPGPVELADGRRRLRSTMHGFRDVVVWNPGSQGEAALGDVAPGDAARMVCIEAGVIEGGAIVHPGSTWSGAQHLSIVHPG
jgi:glucose-6-phosphate 1-epimerase